MGDEGQPLVTIMPQDHRILPLVLCLLLCGCDPAAAPEYVAACSIGHGEAAHLYNGRGSTPEVALETLRVQSQDIRKAVESATCQNTLDGHPSLRQAERGSDPHSTVASLALDSWQAITAVANNILRTLFP
jgi:hypothetical protein